MPPRRRPGGGLGGSTSPSNLAPNALALRALGTPGELSQEKGTCVRCGDAARALRGVPAADPQHDRRGVGSGESSSCATTCPSLGLRRRRP
jgi:hypothetical protein